VQCAKHKQYKGLRPTKRDCPNCNRLYRKVQTEIRDKFAYGKKFRSMTTPGRMLGLVEFLAEVSTCSVHGFQRPYFWSEKSVASTHFQRTMKMLMAWRKRDDKLFGSMNTMLYHLSTQYTQQQVAERLSREEVLHLVQEDDEEDSVWQEEDFELDTVSANKRKGLLSLGKEGAQKKEEDS